MDGQELGRIVPIREVPNDAVKTFSCGVDSLDEWLIRSSREAVSRGECAVHVLIGADNLPVAFFTLSATAIRPADVTNRMRGGLHGFIPATLLGKMGVRINLQGEGYGTHVLRDAMQYALESSKIVSSRLLVVDALTVDLVPWYAARGFRKLPQSENRLVCKMSDIAKMLEGGK